MVNRPGCQTSVLPDPDLRREDAVSRRCVRGFRRRDGQGGEDRGAAAFSLWVKIGPPRTLEALRNEATVAALTAKAKVPASPESDLRLGKAAARRRGCGFLGRDQQGGEPGGQDYRALKVRAMNQAQRTAMIARGGCGVYRRPATPDAEELTLMRWLDEQIRRRRS
jgi:hypothetical protein